MSSIDKNTNPIQQFQTPIFSKEAKQRKIDIQFKKNILCDHITKNISANDIIASHRLTISNESRNA